MITHRVVIAVLAASILAACADIPSAPAGVRDFDSAYQHWQDSAVYAYRYQVQVSCFCADERTRAVNVVVVNGQTLSLLYADSNTTADTVLFSDVRSLDRLFAGLRSILDQHPATFTATYDPALGYPLTVWADPDAQTVDEEIGYHVTGFTELVPPGAPTAESSGGRRPF